MPVTQMLDRCLFGTLTRGWPPERMDNYIDNLRIDDTEGVLPGVIGRTFQIIDTKASGVLTHTSMMVAALGVASRIVADDRFEQAVIVAEIVLYLMVAVGCLRCMEIFDEHAVASSPKAAAAAVRRELILRRELFRLCNRAAIFLTILMLLTLVALFLYVPA